MKFYIAARVKQVSRVKLIADHIKKLGHSVTFDWYSQPHLQPYEKNLERVKKVSKLAVQGIKNCDIFVIITDRSGTGMHTEFGIALEAKKKIFVVGTHLNTNAFFFYPGIKRISSIKEFLKLIK